MIAITTINKSFKKVKLEKAINNSDFVVADFGSETRVFTYKQGHMLVFDIKVMPEILKVIANCPESIIRGNFIFTQDAVILQSPFMTIIKNNYTEKLIDLLSTSEIKIVGVDFKMDFFSGEIYHYTEVDTIHGLINPIFIYLRELGNKALFVELLKVAYPEMKQFLDFIMKEDKQKVEKASDKSKGSTKGKSSGNSDTKLV